MAKKTTDQNGNGNLFASYQPFREKAEDEKRADYARALWEHARPQFPDATEGSLHKFLAPIAGYKSHGSFYAALPGHGGNGASKGTGAKTKDALVAKVGKINEKIAALTADRDALNAKIETWDADHAEDAKKIAEKREKGKERTLNFLSSLTPEERATFLAAFNNEPKQEAAA